MKTILSLIGLVTVTVGSYFGVKAYQKYQKNKTTGTGTTPTGSMNTPPPTLAQIAKEKHDNELALTNLLLINKNLIAYDVKIADLPSGGEGSTEETAQNALQATYDKLATDASRKDNLKAMIPSYHLLREVPLTINAYFKVFVSLKNQLVAKDAQITDVMNDPEDNTVVSLNNDRTVIVNKITDNRNTMQAAYDSIKAKILLPSILVQRINLVLNIKPAIKTIATVIVQHNQASFDGISKRKQRDII